MSKEYIERKWLIHKISQNPAEEANKRCAQLLDAILEAPAADVEPVRHGKWIDTDTFDFHCVHIYQCSNCGKEVADDYISNHKFCLHCGAEMDEGNK